MASSSNAPNTIGLNEISILDVLNLTDQDNTIPTNYQHRLLPLTMNSTKRNEGSNGGGGGGGLSRIPKLTFSFRRPKSATTSSRDNNSPERSNNKSHLAQPSSGKDSGAKSLPNSNQSSPTLGRSKSLRLPRSHVVKALSSSQLRERDRVLDESDDFFPDDDRSSYTRSDVSTTSSFPRPRSSTFSSSGSSSKRGGAGTRAGRSVSPGTGLLRNGGNLYHRGNGSGTTERPGSASYHYSGSLSQADDEPISFTTPQSTKTRGKLSSESFGSHDRIRPPSYSNHPSRRSKTPTSLSSSSSSSSRGGNGGSSGDKLALKRASSLGKVGRLSTTAPVQQKNLTQPYQKPPSKSSSSSSTSSSNEPPRGKRPSSVVVTEDPADLNKIAHELSQPDSDNGSSSWDSPQLETKSVVGRTRTAPTTRHAHPMYYSNRSNTSSPTERIKNDSYTTPSSSGKNLAVRTRSSSIDKSHRPNSARAFYPGGKLKADLQSTQKESDSHVSDLPRPRSVTNLDSESDLSTTASVGSGSSIVRRKNSGSGRTSAPSSGRSTPVHRRTGSLGGGVKGKDSIDGSSVSTATPAAKVGSGLPPRTPYRSIRGKQTLQASGINELEGCVLLEADDYRRIANEVKFLKTALLKLKRELQSDLDDGTPTLSTATPTATPTTRVGRSRASPSNATVNELNKKLKSITEERDKALEEVTKLKKEGKSKASQMEAVSAELKKTKKEKGELEEECKRVEAHRDHLLDKVERLHADKHNLEDRLNTLEKSRFYEQTMSESWLDELDGEEFDHDDLELESNKRHNRPGAGPGGERKETESDLGDSPLSDGGEGENSEPESAAVCSVPFT